MKRINASDKSSILVRLLQRTKLQASGCIEWLGSQSSQGHYGTLGLGHKQVEYVHRAAWRLVHGEIPEGMEVHHTCENRVCVNTEHMMLMTHAMHMATHKALRAKRRLSVCWDRLIGHATKLATGEALCAA